MGLGTFRLQDRQRCGIVMTGAEHRRELFPQDIAINRNMGVGPKPTATRIGVSGCPCAHVVRGQRLINNLSIDTRLRQSPADTPFTIAARRERLGPVDRKSRIIDIAIRNHPVGDCLDVGQSTVFGTAFTELAFKIPHQLAACGRISTDIGHCERIERCRVERFGRGAGATLDHDDNFVP